MRASEIALMTERAFALEPGIIHSGNRAAPVALARHVCCWLLCNSMQLDRGRVAEAIGTTAQAVAYSCSVAEVRMAEDAALADTVRKLQAEIEFRTTLAGCRDQDVIAIANTIRGNPRRAAMAATVNEVVAMATVLIDLWDAAVTAETTLQAIEISPTGGYRQTDADTMAAIRNYRAAFLNHMHAFRNSNGDEDNG